MSGGRAVSITDRLIALKYRSGTSVVRTSTIMSSHFVMTEYGKLCDFK